MRCFIFGHDWIYSDREGYTNRHGAEVDLYTKRVCRRCGKGQEMESIAIGECTGNIYEKWVTVK